MSAVQVDVFSFSPQRPERRLQWLKALREHLNAHVLPVSAARESGKTRANSLQDAVVVALTAPSQTHGPSDRSVRLPLDSEIWTVRKLLEAKQSFRACLQSGRAESAEREDILVERSVVLVAMLTYSLTNMDLVMKDCSGEIPCEVILPAQSINCMVLLREWNLICSSVHGNYLEIEELVAISQSCTHTSLTPHLPSRQTVLSVADVQMFLRGRGGEGGVNTMKGVTLTGRLDAISEPMRNGPELMVIFRLTHTRDDSIQCHIITQSQRLMYLPRLMKLFSIYIFSGLKSVIMNKGKEDEMVVLTTTDHTGVEYVPANQEPSLLSLPPTTDPQRREEKEKESMSPVKKKLRAEEGSNQASQGGTTSERCSSDPTNPVPKNKALISYRGVISCCLLPEAGVYELDDRLTLYLTHSILSNQGRGLREGAEIEIINAHLLKISTPPYKQLSGLVCCPVSRVELLHFSEKNTPFKAFVCQNKLAHLLSKHSAMDVAWLVIVFLSLLKKFKKKESFNVMTGVCAMVGVRSIHWSHHTSFLCVPHDCQLVDPVDLTHRPLLPSLQYILERSQGQVTSPLYCWRGSKGGGGAGVSSSLTGSTSLLSVAMRTTWSYGVMKSTEYPSPQLLIGMLRGNRATGHLELSDSTASIPLLVCIPYPSPSNTANNITDHWLLQARDGCCVALKGFSVITEKTEESEGTKNTKFNIYIHSHNIELIKPDTDHRPFQGGDRRESTSLLPSILYVYIKSKNCLKLQGQAEETAEFVFETQALVHASLEVLRGMEKASVAQETEQPPVHIAVGFTSALYSCLHTGCIYRLRCLQDSNEVLPSLGKLVKEPYISVGDGVSVEMVALPGVYGPGRHATDCLLEVGELVSKSFLPKLPTTYSTKNETPPRSDGGLVSFRGLIKEHSYRIDCATQSASSLPVLSSQTNRHIVALSVRGTHCPNTIMVYCKYTPHQPLPLGLIPGSVAAFHSFCVKSSARAGNMYCVNCPSSSITVESISEAESEKSDTPNKSCDLTREMRCLPVMLIYDLTQRLLQGHLSREIVCVRAVVMAVQHAFIQFQCQTCLCTMIDGMCRATCPAKNATLNTDARFLVQDGTGEAHLYVKDRVLPVALGMTEVEWSDLLDLIYKVGQVTHTKSSSFKSARSSRAVTAKEKVDEMFFDIVTRPSLVKAAAIYCQPFLSSSELQHPLGQRSYRVCLRHSIDYVTLSLPRLQLRALALTPTQPSHHTQTLLAQLEPSQHTN